MLPSSLSLTSLSSLCGMGVVPPSLSVMGLSGAAGLSSPQMGPIDGPRPTLQQQQQQQSQAPQRRGAPYGLVTITHVLECYRRLAPLLWSTPLEESIRFAQLTAATKVFFKYEHLQV